MKVWAAFGEKMIEYVERAHELTYPRRAVLLTHPEMLTPPQNILDYTNVPLFRADGRPINGIPDVRQYFVDVDQHEVALPPDVEEWWFSLFMENKPSYMTEDDAKKAFRDMSDGAKAFFNKHSWDNGYRSVVLGENMDNREGMRLQPTICRRRTVDITKPPFQWGREKQWQVSFRTLNVNKPEDFLNMRYKDLRNRTVIGPAINWYCNPRRDAKGKKLIGHGDPFPGLDGNDIPHVLLSDKDEGRIEFAEIRWLPDDNIPDPYWGRE